MDNKCFTCRWIDRIELGQFGRVVLLRLAFVKYLGEHVLQIYLGVIVHRQRLVAHFAITFRFLFDKRIGGLTLWSVVDVVDYCKFHQGHSDED